MNLVVIPILQFFLVFERTCHLSLTANCNGNWYSLFYNFFKCTYKLLVYCDKNICWMYVIFITNFWDAHLSVQYRQMMFLKLSQTWQILIVADNSYNIYKHGRFIYIFVLYFQAECRLLWQMLLIGRPALGVTPGQQLMLESAVDSHST